MKSQNIKMVINYQNQKRQQQQKTLAFKLLT